MASARASGPYAVTSAAAALKEAGVEARREQEDRRVCGRDGVLACGVAVVAVEDRTFLKAKPRRG